MRRVPVFFWVLRRQPVLQLHIRQRGKAALPAWEGLHRKEEGTEKNPEMVLDFWGNLCYYYGIRKLFRALSRSAVMVASAHLLKGGDKTEAFGKLCYSARPEDEEKFPDDRGNRGEMPGMREAGKAVHPAGARQHGVFRHGWAVSSGKAENSHIRRGAYCLPAVYADPQAGWTT